MTDEPINHGDLSPHTSAPSLSSPSDIPLRIPKNKSTGNLLAPLTLSSSPTELRTRFSFDAGSSHDLNSLKRLARPDHDYGLGLSGLRRIRRPGPSSRKSTVVFDEPESLTPATLYSQGASSAANSRSNSRSASAQFLLGNPVSPVTEDLHRFPSESLHSFSFARQTEDFLHSRQALLQKSMDFMRDHPGWATNSGIMNAQARVSGNTEAQNMMELLRKAKVVPGLDTDAARAAGFGTGPVTGPADFDGSNIFEKSFTNDLDTVLSSARSSMEERREERKGTLDSVQDKSTEPTTNSPEMSPQLARPAPRKSGLKRTYTDVSSMSLQQKLIEALAQPYSSDDYGQAQLKTLSPLGTADRSISTSAVSAVHGYGSKGAPPAQAVFRTSAEAPWTMIAANDLACLTFGVTRAEVRSLSILGIIQEERRQWLEEKLRQPESPIEQKPKSAAATSVIANGPTSLLGSRGGGITARLLSKGPSRGVKSQKAQTDKSSGDPNQVPPPKKHAPTKSRGVILCGDVVPISKRDGTLGAASFWVMEKRGGLIWVVEEITEDVAYLQFDEDHQMIDCHGGFEPIWGCKPELSMTLASLIPQFPAECLDDPSLLPTTIFNFYTASTIGGVNVPISVAVGSVEREIRIASLPHIAGAMVIDPSSLKISSSNPVFSAALFGYEQPNGMEVTELIPSFAELLEILTEENEHKLIDGTVIPEHSFRRARALLAIREGTEHAANIFLRPAGLLAQHKDGAELMVDIQMRVVRSETVFPVPEDVILEEKDDETVASHIAVDELVYAVWITYSRQLHSASLGVDRPEHLASRPVTPPSQPPPGALPSPPATVQRVMSLEPAPLSIAQTLDDPTDLEPIEHPPLHTAYIPHPKKNIRDFDILEEMGKGAYGEVKLARYRCKRAQKVVLKYVVKKRILVDTWTRDRRLGTVPLEIHVLDYLRSPGMQHPNIVEMIDFFEDDANYYIEMLPHGLPGMDLFDYIELRVNMEETECKNIFRQVVDAVYHLHVRARIIHRDIKDENVVLDGEGNVKLIDFGSATYIKNGPFEVFVGTLDYAAPEVLQGKPYGGKEQDVWALGILLYTLVYRENPFYNIDEILDHPLRVPYIPFSELCIDLIRRMLDRDVDERITIEEVSKHDWLLED